MGSLYVALMHGQVVDKTGKEIASALTHFDVHDIARSCRTYGVTCYFVVTPLETMRYLAQRMIAYWQSGLGTHTIPNRTDALEIVDVKTDLDQVIEKIRHTHQVDPLVVATSARDRARRYGYTELADWIRCDKAPLLLLFGTAYGLCESVFERCDGVLPPIRSGGWNHLSVRSAVAITLERLAGEDFGR